MSVRLWPRWVLTVVALMGGELASAQDRLPPMPVAPKDTLVVDPRILFSANPSALHVMREVSPHVLVGLEHRASVTETPEPLKYDGSLSLGIGCSQPTATLQSQLKLSPGIGLVVGILIRDSRAAKAGLKVHDVLLKTIHAGKAAYPESFGELLQVIETADDDVQLTVVRGGNQFVVTLPPGPQFSPFDIGRFTISSAYVVFTDSQVAKAADNQLSLQVAGPAFAVTRALPPALPEGVSVNITRTGTEPAQVTIRHGDDAWIATEKDLSAIPEEFRGAVAVMLNPVSGHMAVFKSVPGSSHLIRQRKTRLEGTGSFDRGPTAESPQKTSRATTEGIPFTSDIHFFEAGPTTLGKPPAAGAPGTASKAGQHVKAVKVDRVSPSQAAEIAQRIETEMTARLDQLQTLQTLNQLLEKQQQFQQLQQAAVARQEQLLQELQTKVETLLQAQQPASAEAAAGAAPRSN